MHKACVALVAVVALTGCSRHEKTATDVAQSLVGYLEDLGGSEDPHGIAVRRRRR